MRMQQPGGRLPPPSAPANVNVSTRNGEPLGMPAKWPVTSYHSMEQAPGARFISVAMSDPRFAPTPVGLLRKLSIMTVGLGDTAQSKFVFEPVASKVTPNETSSVSGCVEGIITLA